MCGILVSVTTGIAANEDLRALKRQFAQCLLEILSRGPDSSVTIWLTRQPSDAHVSGATIGLGHARLVVNGSASASNSIFSHTCGSSTLWSIANGEIYNHVDLQKRMGLSVLTCDTHVIAPAYEHFMQHLQSDEDHLTTFLRSLDGIYAFALYDDARARIVAARDKFGVKPLFFGCVLPSQGNEMPSVHISSVLAGIPDSCGSVVEVPAGHCLVVNVHTLEHRLFCYFPSALLVDPTVQINSFTAAANCVRKVLSAAVSKRLMVNPNISIGILLSGGIDSSAVAALACASMSALGPSTLPLHSFCVGWASEGSAATGVSTSEDIRSARLVAEHLGLVHHEVMFTSEEGLSVLSSVIEAVETYDVPTIRAAVPLFFLVNLALRHDVKVVLCGEGADEVFGGYARFQPIRSSAAGVSFHAECVRLINGLFQTELLRVDRCTQGLGLEARVPFMDPDVVRMVLGSVDVSVRQRGEKALLRQAVRDLLPSQIVDRPKKQFADGCGHGWLDDLKRWCSEQVGDESLQMAADRFPVDTPGTKEGYYYRQLFEQKVKSHAKRACVYDRHHQRRLIRLHMTRELGLMSTNLDIDLASRLYRCAGVEDVIDDPLSTLVNQESAAAFLEMLLGTHGSYQWHSLPVMSRLNLLIRAHLSSIPFQNLTMLTRPRRPPLLKEILLDCQTGIGGPCSVINTHFAAFLRTLGFKVRLACASIQQPDCHFIIIVTLDNGIDYFVDVGNAHHYFEAVALGPASNMSTSAPDTRVRCGAGVEWKVVPYHHGGDVSQLIDAVMPRYAVMHRTSSRDPWRVGMHFNRAGRSWHFFQPMIVQSRSQETFGPFLRSVRMIIFPADSATQFNAQSAKLVAIKGAQMQRATVGDPKVSLSIDTYVEMADLVGCHFKPLVSLLPSALHVLEDAGHDVFEATQSVKYLPIPLATVRTTMQIGSPHCAGIHALEVYIPKTFVSQTELETFDGVSEGKYTIGLGQANMAIVDPAEDVISLAKSAMQALIEKYGLKFADIGRIEVGTESMVDKSKSVKSHLMDEFNAAGVHDVVGVDCINACYGGTAALLNALNWVDSPCWNGRYAIVLAGDIAVYEAGPARPTGGAGMVAMLVGRDAPIVIDTRHLTSHSENVWDFYKPNMASEYPTVDGALSNNCYKRSVDNCYSQFVTKSGRDIASFDYVLMHSPYIKLVQKSFSRMILRDALTPGHASYGSFAVEVPDLTSMAGVDPGVERAVMKACVAQFEAMVMPTLRLNSECGNMHAGSLWASLCSLVGNDDVDLVKKSALVFSYGSGSIASMFTVHFRDERVLLDIRASLRLSHKLAEREKVSPKVFASMLDARKACQGPSPLGEEATSDGRIMFPKAYYRTRIDSALRRFYRRVSAAADVQ